MCLYVMCEKPFFVSFSAAQFPSLSRSFSILVCVACVRASAFTDTYFISKQDFSVCDLLRPLLRYISGSVRAKIHWFQISDDYTLYYYTYSHKRRECTCACVCVCVEKKEKTVNYCFDIIFMYTYIYNPDRPTDDNAHVLDGRRLRTLWDYLLVGVYGVRTFTCNNTNVTVFG